MTKKRGGGQVGSRRSRRTQGLEVVDPTPQLKVKKRTAKKMASPKKNLVLTPTRRRSRIKKVAAEDDEIEDVTPAENDEVEDVTRAHDDEVEDVTPEDGGVVEEDKDDPAEKEMSEEDKDDAGIEGEDDEDGAVNGKENEEEAANMEDDGVLNENGNEEEALDMEEDGVSNAQDDEIPSTEGVELAWDEVQNKNKKGPTKLRRVAENPNEKIMVTFNDFGDHIGPGSVTLSSFLGPLVSEHVPVTLADWRNLDAATKATTRFNLQEEWQKAVIFKQLGNVWKAGKSRLVSQVRVAKTAAEGIALKPSNIPSIQVWNSWVKSKTTKSLTEVSNKYREMRRNQIPHTTSCKGMLRLADDMEQIQSLDSQIDSTSTADNIREDAVSKVLGKDKHVRVRGFGRGITATKLAFLQFRDAKMAEMKSEIEELKGMVRDLAGKKKSNGDAETSESSGGFKEGVRVQILDWIESEDVVVGEGEFCSAEPKFKIGRISIGPNAVAIIVKYALSSVASLWRPTTDVLTLDEAVGYKIAWLMDKVFLQSKEGESRRCKIYDWTNDEDEVIAEGLVCSSKSKEIVNNIPLGPNAVSIEVVKVFNDHAYLWRPTADMFLISDALSEKRAWLVLKSPCSTSSTRSPKHKCILLDCNNSGRKVAEGRVASTDPNELCHFVPLGPNESKVWIDVAKIGDAKVWRLNSEIEYISDAVGSVVAWPNDKIMFV
ncbi:hypothetical protein N665_0123s0016 [Sinapis alba]|nr:hypothetical protein N665_0123s0016 [Sinapis alba]